MSTNLPPTVKRISQEEFYLSILRGLISYHERMTMRKQTPYDGMMCNLSGGRLVVGEFVCDKIDVIQRRGIPANFDYCYLSLNEWGNDDIETEIRDIMGSCIPKERLNSYAGKTPVLYAWHISDLKVYDTPKPLSAFKGLCKIEVGCWKCPYYNYTKMDCDGRTIKRPPQSWCYVEELQ